MPVHQTANRLLRSKKPKMKVSHRLKSAAISIASNQNNQKVRTI